jgi:NAD(P)-dependent dehydrogenase (short-subunit alcohol dehydrogenase family)
METANGLELQLGPSFLGPFALTALLLPLLLRADAPRVATMSSGTANWGRIRFDDLQSRRSYSPSRAYAQSKLADVMQARHLAALAEARGCLLASVGPNTGEQDASPRESAGSPREGRQHPIATVTGHPSKCTSTAGFRHTRRLPSSRGAFRFNV